MKVLKGDTVKVLIGKDAGRTGEIERVLPKDGKVMIAGFNLVSRHTKSSTGKPGGIIKKSLPMSVSNVMLVCPHCNLPTRVGYRMEKDQKVRFCHKCQKTIKK